MNIASVSRPAEATENHARPAYTPPPAPLAPPSWSVSVLGVPFDNLTVDTTLARIDTMIASRRPHYLVTANVDFLVQAHHDVELRRILLEADLVLCDGTPIRWASRWLGNPLAERAAGSDLAPSLMRNAAQKGHRIFFLGAGPGVAAAATARVQEQFPGVKIVGHYAPPFSALLEMDHAEIARRIREAKPDILLVSFGCPKQEKWIAMHYRSLGVPVSIGVGATIDFLAGRVRRAPDWMRTTGTEWIFRLLLEPRRLYRRYAKDLFYFLPALARQRLCLGSGKNSDDITAPHFTFGSDWLRIEAGERLTRDSLDRHGVFWRTLLDSPGHCLFDASKLRHVDATGIAFLTQWRKRLQAAGRHLVVVAPSGCFNRTLRGLRLAEYFPIAETAGAALHYAQTSASQTPVVHDSVARTVAWCGEIVAANVEDAWQTTTDHIRTFAQNQATLIVIDLSRLKFIDSAGAALMLRIKKWAQQFPAEIIFARPQPNVRNVLELTRLDQILLEGAQ